MGAQKALIAARALHVLSAVCVVWAAVEAQGGIFFWLGAAIFAGLLVFQHAQVTHNDLRKVNLAFFTANGIASVVFAVFVGIDLLT
jgi:4-hydroxybenzoate polyprenyltransferase